MNYPIVLHKDSDSDFGVSVPDLPGCFSAGATIDEAVDMAKEAIELHLIAIHLHSSNITGETLFIPTRQAQVREISYQKMHIVMKA